MLFFSLQSAKKGAFYLINENWQALGGLEVGHSEKDWNIYRHVTHSKSWPGARRNLRNKKFCFFARIGSDKNTSVMFVWIWSYNLEAVVVLRLETGGNSLCPKLTTCYILFVQSVLKKSKFQHSEWWNISLLALCKKQTLPPENVQRCLQSWHFHWSFDVSSLFSDFWPIPCQAG